MKLLILPPPLDGGEDLVLRESDGHYLVHVRRMSSGDALQGLGGPEFLYSP